MTRIVGFTRYKDSRWIIKLEDGKYHNYARYLYEKAYGKQPSDYIMVYMDGNSKNVNLSNLEMISKRQSVYIRANKLKFSNKQELKALCLLSDLATAIPHYVRPSRRKKATS